MEIKRGYVLDSTAEYEARFQEDMCHHITRV